MAVTRENMLEYTRKVSLEKHCFSKVCTMEYKDGKVTNYRKCFFDDLPKPEQRKALTCLKSIPFSKDLKEIVIAGDSVPANKSKAFNDAFTLLKASVGNELSSDTANQLIPVAIEKICSKMTGKWKVTVAYGTFSIPTKRIYEKDSGYSPESEDIYCHIIAYATNGTTQKGIMYPAYDRTSLFDMVDALK